VVRLVTLPNNAKSRRNKEMRTITRQIVRRIENKQVLLLILLHLKLYEDVILMEKTLANVIEMFVDGLVVLSLELQGKHKWFIDSNASKHVIKNKGCLMFLNNHNGPISFRSKGR
jgi:hypothetical protein